jgi:hypothetical protein
MRADPGNWEPTRATVARWSAVVGRLAQDAAPPAGHLWHAALRPGVRGLVTGRLGPALADGTSFELGFDFASHELVATGGDGRRAAIGLADPETLAGFEPRLAAALAEIGVDRAGGFEPHDASDASDAYDPEAATRLWLALDWAATVLTEFAGWFAGKQSPVLYDWRSGELGLSRYSGRPAPPDLRPEDDPIGREVLAAEVLHFGFRTTDPAFTAWVSPEPDGLAEQPLAPEDAAWAKHEQEGWTVAVLPYTAVLASADRRATLLAFLQSAYDAGAGAGYWDREGLASSFAPQQQS